MGAESICRPSLKGKLSRRRSTVGVEHLCFEDHLRRLVGELVRKTETSLVESALKGSALWTLETDTPAEEVSVLQAYGHGEVAFALLSD